MSDPRGTIQLQTMFIKYFPTAITGKLNWVTAITKWRILYKESPQLHLIASKCFIHNSAWLYVNGGVINFVKCHNCLWYISMNSIKNFNLLVMVILIKPLPSHLESIIPKPQNAISTRYNTSDQFKFETNTQFNSGLIKVCRLIKRVATIPGYTLTPALLNFKPYSAHLGGS